MKKKMPKVATFSIIGYDPETKETGIAVQSKFLGVGAVVPWAEAGTGAVATQSFAHTGFGPEGLRMLKEGKPLETIIDELIQNDPDRELRQFAIMDNKGNTAAYTGSECYDWAGHRKGRYCTAQGNILVSRETVDALVTTFEEGTGSLAERLLAALHAAQEAGGDSRGKQSAALFVVQNEGGYGGYNDRKYDLRVDDHSEPIDELSRLFELHQLYFTPPREQDLLALEGEVLTETADLLQKDGLLGEVDAGRETVYQALKQYVMRENFEERWQEDYRIDPAVLRYMRSTIQG
ncbi:DUF1028 domain-containing protein [Alkalicoccus urumqiensis]|uniref:Fimbrial assembly protein FimA n=1 Tax=Alkalicoccus urumqiensis TaxID=1548213 RepID=A0A2P6MEJ8_ALKUR|nr:DUF1028 domain-containing protein [Alkalicoccus urumqiensis]PRO64719.1 fimbrial assembly protein FimA [Alkalicoccus urumqiensis]